MDNKRKNNSYNSELISLIKSGVKPEEAVKIADSHVGNCEKAIEQVAEERKIENETLAEQTKIANNVKTRIVNNHEKPEAIVNDLNM